MTEPLTTRDATPEDSAAIAAIYNQGIEDRSATFETALRSPDDVRAWFDGLHPTVVVTRGVRVVGFATTSAFRTRACYARNAEFSVYVAREARGQGAGTLAMRTLIARCREAGFWKLLSGTFAENAASLGMLGRLGFRPVGTYAQHAQLDGVWKDVTIVERLVAPTVLFACVHNAGRSQMAAAWFHHLADRSRVLAISAGTQPGAAVHPEVLVALREVGLEVDHPTPRLLTPELAATATRLVTLGCGEACPVVPGVAREDWPVADPKGQPLAEVRQIRDELRDRVTRLLAAEGWSRPAG